MREPSDRLQNEPFRRLGRRREAAGTAGEQRSSTSLLEATEHDLIIQAVGVVKTYDTGKIRVPALRGIDLQVRRGEMVAVMGPSGSGKTTLLNCLSGLDTVDAGTILIAGRELARLSDNERSEFRSRHMGFIFQLFNLIPVLTAVENVELPLLIAGVKPAEARRRAMEALDQVGLTDRAGHKPAELSGGQQQRVAIARALANQPEIVWADEPTGNLDTQNAEEVLALMRELNHRNRQTFVIVTHDPRIGAACDRVIRMQDGLIVDDGHALAE
ncbi:ABC transporter ATP-binding protein [Thermomicrobiaceae bacterium CFH 74404]|uniref:ABC transporter ATP-binding protein n=1 Tax=Thermalbibacter longus TaxID=2951981 RepID=A0AA42BDT4_9BACT|nr:ABC transporter ATP-binding protein [Thermalbibacter longus]MCM8750063.1 ABC transporter ATP-binding protein [Thermalbibacter longus]